MRCLLLLCLWFAGCSLGLRRAPKVSTSFGQVEGTLSKRGNYYEFTGIRYAVPVKFKAPSLPPSSPEVFKADIRSVACAQPDRQAPFVLPTDNEDCLVLNIFTPSNFTKTSSLPVMVFIHGGDFEYGSSTPEYYGPEFLVSKGVVMVSFNYRLNAYGFLNLGIKEAPGNAGLKDMRAALRWIQGNIKEFGGNPKNVTVFGQGSGGTSAIYLTMSPTTKGLFHRIIVESGTLFTKDSFDPKPLETAKIVGEALQSKAKTPEELLEVFTKTPIDKVMKALKGIAKRTKLFAPSLETVFEDEEPFLIDTPYNILATGLSHSSLNPVPIIIGHTTSEMLSKMVDFKDIEARYEEIESGDYSSFIPRSLHIENTADVQSYIKEIKHVYLANTTDHATVMSAIYNFENDFSDSGPLSLFCDLYTNKTGLPVYTYLFEYAGGRNLGRQIISMNNSLAGTTHYDELFYILELESGTLPREGLDLEAITAMTTLWTNFAKFGTPSPSGDAPWHPHPAMLALSPTPHYVGFTTPERDAYWRSVYFRHGADIRKGAPR